MTLFIHLIFLFIFFIGSSSIYAQTSSSFSFGDANNDMVINVLDYQILSSQFGKGATNADFNGDGQTNVLDYAVLSNNFGKTITPSVTPTPTTINPDVTSQVQKLGNPFLTRYPLNSRIYPRNVWDMQLFNNKIYMGSGNSSNSGISGNAGPVDIWAYDLATNQFVNEYTVDEEQIDMFRIFNNILYIPGHDPRVGNIGYYRLENSGWTGYNRISGFQHVYDMTEFGNELFAALGTASYVSISTDSATTWKNSAALGQGRVYSIFDDGNKVYATKGVYTDKGYNALDPSYQTTLIGLYEYTGNRTFIPRPDLKFSVVFPGYNGDILASNPYYTIGKIIRHVKFNNKVVYIGGNQFDDHQTLPFGLFAAGPIENAIRIPLPTNTTPWDTLVRGNTLYVLLSQKDTSGKYVVSIVTTTDLINLKTLFHFTADSFARSFEMTPDGNFIFGLGTGMPTTLDFNNTATWEVLPVAGDILKVDWQ